VTAREQKKRGETMEQETPETEPTTAGSVRVEAPVRQAQRVRNVLVDVRLTAEAPRHVERYCRTPQERGTALRAWVREFEDFIRDHRSQDAVLLDVEEERKDLCSACGEEWETMEEDGKTICANCGTEVA
jgi:hypothetical protein